MEFKPMYFAAASLVVCIIFAVIGGYWYYTTSDEITAKQEVVDDFENPESDNYFFYETQHSSYKNATKELKDAKDSLSTSYIFFIVAGVFLLVAIALAVIHFIIEKKADDKMAAGFFVDGPPPK